MINIILFFVVLLLYAEQREHHRSDPDFSGAKRKGQKSWRHQSHIFLFRNSSTKFRQLPGELKREWTGQWDTAAGHNCCWSCQSCHAKQTCLGQHIEGKLSARAVSVVYHGAPINKSMMEPLHFRRSGSTLRPALSTELKILSSRWSDSMLHS